MNSSLPISATPVLRLGATSFTVGELAVMGVIVLGIILLFVALSFRRGTQLRFQADAEAADRTREAEARMESILRAQSEMHGRLGALAEVFGTRQAELTKTIGDRLDGMTSRLGQSMSEQTRATHDNLVKLQERLAVIDTAQTNIQSLAGQVVQLQAILSNKQTRGAFGQSRMEAIVADGLPGSSYEFQATLSNGSRPDCLVRMPNGAPSLVIDAKFPLEAWNAIRAAAESDGSDAGRAAQAFRRDIEVHIRDIAEKYLIPGETQDTAFMFVPSESIFAEIHENFEAIVQRAHRLRIVIVSPSLLMLSIQVIQSVLKDARMREQAHLIQGEVLRMMEDVNRLDDRVRKLQAHFSLTQKDVEQILTSTEKITKRGEKIETLEVGEAEDAGASDGNRVSTGEAAATSKTGQLRLRVVEEE